MAITGIDNFEGSELIREVYSFASNPQDSEVREKITQMISSKDCFFRSENRDDAIVFSLVLKEIVRFQNKNQLNCSRVNDAVRHVFVPKKTNDQELLRYFSLKHAKKEIEALNLLKKIKLSTDDEYLIDIVDDELSSYERKPIKNNLQDVNDNKISGEKHDSEMLSVPSSLLESTGVNSNPQLLTEEIIFSPDEFSSSLASEAADNWVINADNKEQLATSNEEITQFFDCSNNSAIISKYLKEKNPYWRYFLCKDNQGNFQGMMTVRVQDDHVLISYLVTNPNNIRSSLNDHEPNTMRGVGTQLLKKAEGIALLEGKKNVCLDALPSSVGFYEKLGYQKLNEDSFQMYKVTASISCTDRSQI